MCISHTYTYTPKKKKAIGRRVDGLTLKDKGRREEGAKRQRRELKRDTCIESEKDGRWTELRLKEGRNREPNREKLLANIWTLRTCNITT